MPFDFQQYQQKAQPILGWENLIQNYESTWHQPWSEPVRFKIAKGLAIALAASGQFSPILSPDTQINPYYESKWHYAWSEPVRKKIGMHVSQQQSLFMIVDRPPFNVALVLYPELEEPVRNHRSLQHYLHQSFTAPERLLPHVGVTGTLAATEVNNDLLAFGIDVYTTPPAALDLTDVEISITEIVIPNGASASIKESE